MLGFVVAGLWLLTYVGLARYGVYLLPSALARQLTLSSYLALVQLLSTSMGIALTLVGSRRDPALLQRLLPLWPTSPEAGRGSSQPMLSGLLIAVLAAPALYVLAHSSGMYLAYDTLLRELAQRGAQAVQAQTGEFGRSTLLDSAWVIVPFTVLIAPLGEELLFRGAVYGAIQRLIVSGTSSSPKAAGSRDSSPPSSLRIAGLSPRTPWTESILRFMRDGGAAWFGSSLLFGLMHCDTPGGMGIMRAASAAVLGVGCGWARRTSNHLLMPIALHAGYNLVSLATLRGWIVFAGWPTRYALPTILLAIAPGCLLLGAALLILRSRAR